MDILIVGNAGGTNVGASLHRAASGIGVASQICDSRLASAGLRVASTFSWRLLGHRPLHLESFSRTVIAECTRHRPRVLLTTGMAPLTAACLTAIGEMGIRRVNYSTDDPWNPGFQARWFFDALPLYDRIYTARRSNIDDFCGRGCKDVHYLPFAYDETLWLEPGSTGASTASVSGDIFFAGAAEEFRVRCIREFVSEGMRAVVAGDYWGRVRGLQECVVGHLSPSDLKNLTRAIPISLCCVRRANRDGHVMRSFEIPAIGTCMLVENTEEHREIFGQDGEAVRYFNSPGEAAGIAKELLRNAEYRQTLARSAHARILESANTYRDRLRTMLLPEGLPETSQVRHSLMAAAE
jgi:spore maturation protein CgeB